MATVKFKTIDEYHAAFPADIQLLLDKMRVTIRQAVPGAAEVISYNMPAFRQHGVLVYYAANKAHIGFYPTASPMTVFAADLEQYNTSKGAIQFPLDKPLPVTLIKKIVKYRVQEDIEKAAAKKKKK
ncbi:MAG: DUF1801 domain-containing protein [Chitinophagales bacterium]|nr:DUF1801 domain-containing protein [Chitinophagales bacterium]